MHCLQFDPRKASCHVGMGMFLHVIDEGTQADYIQSHGLHLVPRIANVSVAHCLTRKVFVSFHDPGMVCWQIWGFLPAVNRWVFLSALDYLTLTIACSGTGLLKKSSCWGKLLLDAFSGDGWGWLWLNWYGPWPIIWWSLLVLTLGLGYIGVPLGRLCELWDPYVMDVGCREWREEQAGSYRQADGES